MPAPEDLLTLTPPVAENELEVRLIVAGEAADRVETLLKI